ncbi:hypothetical protein [Tenacibaculum agarivorans]|uniref:hypothetical protein n=1 Tax=Tenacibaculum agarivorans TaxID=1908389 RepID=UPI00094B94C8|nr:hypothetical protein [Tenacibaculum agarivorans]
MKSHHKIVSFLLSLVIILIHVTLLIHTIEHHHHVHHETKFSNFSTLENKIEVSEKCKLFDIYLDIKLLSVSNSILSLFIADYDIVDQVAKKEDQLITVFLRYKKSRSPPKFLTKTS